MSIKQGYALKNWVEGISDEVYYPWESPKKMTKNVSPTFATEQEECFDLLIKANLRVFQNHRKQARINMVSDFFPLLGLNKPP